MSSNDPKKRSSTDNTASQEKKQHTTNPPQTIKIKQQREKCHQLYAQSEAQSEATIQEETITLPWLPYRGEYFSKVEIQTHTKQFFLRIGFPTKIATCTNTHIIQVCAHCKAHLLEAKQPTIYQLNIEKKTHEDDSINQPSWADIQKKVKKNSSKTFRISHLSFQHNANCVLFKTSVIQKKVEGVYMFDVSPAFYLNKVLLDLAEEYSKEDPFTHSYDQISPMPGLGVQDNHRYFTSIFVQAQTTYSPGVRERDTDSQQDFALSLYKKYCEEKGHQFDGLATVAIKENMKLEFEGLVQEMNVSENIWGLIVNNSYTKVVKKAKVKEGKNFVSVKHLLNQATIPQAPVTFQDMCRYASLHRRMAGLILPFERWSAAFEMKSLLVIPEEGVKADSERVSLIRFLYQRSQNATAQFAEKYSAIMFALHMFLCYDCGLEVNILGPKASIRSPFQRSVNGADMQMNIAGFLKGGKTQQSAHRDVKGMSSAPHPKPKSGSILVVLKGTRRLQIRDTVYELKPGMAVWFDGDVVHNGMDNQEGSLALHLHVDDKSYYRVAYDLDLAP
jgi:hypothetical protein